VNNMSIPREPTAEEKQYLVKRFASRRYGSDEAKQQVENAHIAVFDNYTAKEPVNPAKNVYSGKVMLVLWNDKPSHYELYTFGDDWYAPIVWQE
jgi:hypothetical protein